MFGNVKTLPEPVGDYAVGNTYFDFVDNLLSKPGKQLQTKRNPRSLKDQGLSTI
ncbi:hypothetical protein [Paenibacillus borealis]|uniref:hypothetical protein n=1 Tax=Paenibacillus borealis TaxID=160799 RepID=UPI000B158955|nr:hypothetical protein [Paenibacillus borealis]